MKSVGFCLLISLSLTIQVFASDDTTKVRTTGYLLEKAQKIRTQYPDSAIQLLEHCYNAFIANGDTAGAIQSLKQWANASGHLADYRESYDKLWKALILANEANMIGEMATIYIRIGRYYSFYKRKKEALHYLGLSLKIKKQLVAEGTLSKANLVQNYYSFCSTYRELNEPALAQQYLDSCFSFYAPESGPISLNLLKFEQAFLLKESQRYKDALAIYHEIKPWYEQTRPSQQVLLFTYMADTYKALKNYSVSKSYYLAALDISKTYNSHIDFSPLVHGKLADLYVSMKEFSLAYQSLSRAKALDEKFFDSRSERNRPLLEIQDEFRKDQENREQFLQKQRIAQLENEDKVLFLQRTVLIVSLILLVLLGVFYFNYVRSKLRAEKLEHEKIKEINQIKLRFFTNISHEFKTPLTLILGPLQRLLTMEHIDEGVKSSLKMMERNAVQLKRLINQIIEFRKVETAEIKLNASRGDMVYFCKEIAASFKILAEENHIALSFTSLQDEVELWFDSDKLEKILNNLISNAIKYTPESGEIKVVVAKKDGMLAPEFAETFPLGFVEIVVEDTGKGIPGDQLERVFERYYQINTGEYEVQIGSGIGLALTKELVALHKGEISLDSEQGRGSRFTIRLPLGNQYAAVDPKDPFDIAADDQANEFETTQLFAGLPQNEPIKIEPKDLPVLLIIEDNPDMLVFVREIFENGYRIRIATNGQSGLELALSEVPDLIICDVMMPLMDGIEVCKQLKSHEVTNHIPIVLLTGRSAIEHRILGIETGADAYISKPFHTQHLEVRVQKLLEQRETLRKKYEEGNIKLDSQKFGIKEAERSFLEKVEEIIELNLTNSDFTVVELTKELGFSRMQLYRKLKSLTGLSANEYVRAYKIKKAAAYLKDSHLNITEILYEVGFSSRSYFSKCFKQMYGMSPREYINEHKLHKSNRFDRLRI